MATRSIGRSRNQERIFHLLQREGELTRQDIAYKLALSMPTALQYITELVDRGILEEHGNLRSTGGRKAKKIRLNRLAGLAVGIDIALRQVHFVVIDLMGNTLSCHSEPLVFRDDPEWYHALGRALGEWLSASGFDCSRVKSAGVSFPGIIHETDDLIVHSHIFGLEHVSLNRFHRAIPFPLVIANDANCACFAEHSLRDPTYLYISLNESVGGAVMIENRLQTGDTFQGGEIGHILLFPGGKNCYCGKHGCADAYLSPRVLTGRKGSLDDFFARLDDGEVSAQRSWDAYLDHLAIFVTNLRMLLNIDIMIGGEVGLYIRPYLETLSEKAGVYDLFARDVDYILPSVHGREASAVGAARLSLERYGCSLLTEESTVKK